MTTTNGQTKLTALPLAHVRRVKMIETNIKTTENEEVSRDGSTKKLPNKTVGIILYATHIPTFFIKTQLSRQKFNKRMHVVYNIISTVLFVNILVVLPSLLLQFQMLFINVYRALTDVINHYYSYCTCRIGYVISG